MSEISLKAEEIFKIGNFFVTNSLLMSLIVLAFLAVLVFFAKKRFKLVPGGVQNIFEMAIEKLLSLMDSVLGSREKSERYFPLVATIFIFILVSNWLGILPGVGSFFLKEGDKHVPLLRSPASDLNFTLALAVTAVIATNLFGILIFGIITHFKKFFNFSNPINFFIGILELISELAKIVSFSFRLFGNVFAGEVLLTIIFFLVPYIAPLPFLFLEIFVGFMQAFVFAMLTLVFIALHTAQAYEH